MIFTDHKPLTYALESATDRSPRQARHLSFIVGYTSDIRHVKGSENVVADTLSRPAVEAISLPLVDFTALSAAQGPINSYGDSSLQLKRVSWNGMDMICDV